MSAVQNNKIDIFSFPSSTFKKCECCPFGHHVNVDFVEFAKDISHENEKVHKIQRFKQKIQRSKKDTLLSKVEAAETRNCKSLDNTDFDNDVSTPYNEHHLQEMSDYVFLSNDNSLRSTSSSSTDSPKFNTNNNTSNFSRRSFKQISYNDQKPSISSKSFVVSYEHLMSLRDQMSTSLKRVQELESEVKQTQHLKVKFEQIIHQNKYLQNEINVLRDRVSRVQSEWKDLSDIPLNVIQNFERIFNINLETLSNSKCDKLSQTDSLPHNTAILHTSLSVNVSEQETQTNLISKVKKRNFGVTVRPVHHHFTQQITTSSVIKGLKPEECLSHLLDWLNTVNVDVSQKIGVIIYNILALCFKNSYEECINMLKEELFSFHLNYQADQISKTNQTDPVLLKDVTTECNDDIVIKNEMFSKLSQTESVRLKDAWTQWCNIKDDATTQTLYKSFADAALDVDIKTATVEKCTEINNNATESYCVEVELKKEMNDIGLHFADKVAMHDVALLTDEFLINEMVANQIEKSMDIIHEELKAEILESYSRENSVSESGAVSVQQLSLANSQYCPLTSSVETQTSNAGTLKNLSHLSKSHYETSFKLESVELKSPTLIRSDIQQMSINGTSVLSTDIVNDNDEEEEKSDINNLCKDTNISTLDELANKDKTKCELKTSELFTTNADTKETMLTINSNVIKQDGDTNSYLILSSEIRKACELVTLWMNDSTTICSKDLNESLAAIRNFWFEITNVNSTNLQIYLQQFFEFSPILKEKIINMTDANGNTCLHYAVSEGRWSIVKQVLDTQLADINKVNKAGYTVLMLAAVCDKLDDDVLKQLIKQAQIDKQSENDVRQTALMVSASQGKTLLVQCLLEAGASVNITDNDGSTALMCACDNGHLEVVRLLLGRPEVDTELKDNAGSNAMKIALDNSYKDIALLIFAKNNLQKGSNRSKRRSGSNSSPTSPMSQRKFK